MNSTENATEVFAWGKKIATLLEYRGKIYFETESDTTLKFSPLL